MPINKKKGERKSDFINRCIGIEVSGGMKTDQAAAVCYNYWEELSLKELKKKRKEQKLEDTKMMEVFDNSVGEDYTKLGITFKDLMNPKNQGGIVEDADMEFMIFADIPEGFEVRYKYMPGPGSGYSEDTGYGSKSRPFCKGMFSGSRLNKWWDRREIETLNNDSGKVDFVLNKGRKRGEPARTRGYSVFNWRGGNNCKHVWIRYYYNPTTEEFLQTPVQPTQRSTKPQ
jgi:hypothetical protein